MLPMFYDVRLHAFSNGCIYSCKHVFLRVIRHFVGQRNLVKVILEQHAMGGLRRD
jgi:hypothetical protein